MRFIKRLGVVRASALSAAVAAAVAAGAIVVPLSLGSSHREAPNIMLDPTADNTDTYAFVAPNATKDITIVGNWVPGENPANGPNFFRFDDRAFYYLNIDNTGDGRTDLRYLYRFKTRLRNPRSFLYAVRPVNSVYDKNLNTFQTYTLSLERFRRSGRRTRVSSRVLARNVPVSPSNVGSKTMPNYGRLAAQAIHKVRGGGLTFAGQRDDPFFVDLGATFDSINFRSATGNTGGGKDDFSGNSIEAIVLQVPKSQVTSNRRRVSGPKAGNAVVGVWASTERRALQVTNQTFNSNRGSRGPQVQVSRLGNPLFNEVIDPLSRKDLYNRTQPQNDGRNFSRFVRTPELAAVINKLFPVVRAPTKNRTDLVQVFLTGIPGLNQIGRHPAQADTLKLNLGIPPSSNPNRFGVLGGDMAGFPNGRRLADDIVDIDLEAVAGYLKGNRAPLGDGVDQNDKPFLTTFPYLALPTGGFDSAPSDRFEPGHTPVPAGGGPSAPTGASPPGLPSPPVSGAP